MKLRLFVRTILSTAMLIASAQITFAASATWLQFPVDSGWSNPCNWTGDSQACGHFSAVSPPNGPNDTATFGSSTITNIEVSSVDVDSIVFGNSGFTINVGYPGMGLYGGGITGAGSFNVSANMSFLNSATAGPATISVSGNLSFNNNSTAGTASIGLSNAGLDFNDTSTAGAATIAASNGHGITFNGTSSAGGASITITDFLTTLDFYNTSTAGNASFDISVGPALVTFHDSATAGTGNFINNGYIVFSNNSTAGNATITNPSAVTFSDASNAGGATISNSNGGGMDFAADSSAGSATISNDNGAATLFYNTSTAGSSTIVANGGGSIIFDDSSTGGTARLEVFDTSYLDISGNASSGVTIGSIEGTGNVSLGGKTLTVGNNNLSTTFSGNIQGTGALAKIGGGTLTFEGRNTNDYIVDTAGLVLVSGSIINLNFSGAPDVIASLVVDGVSQDPGVYGSSASGAPNPLPEFAGPGTVKVCPTATRVAGVKIHITRAARTLPQGSRAVSREAKIESVPISVPPTRSTFMASWPSVTGATSYRLDVSTTSGFGSYVYGYRDLDVGANTSRIVTGLTPGTTYYYRVRAYYSQTVLSNSAVETVATAGGRGLVISPDLDSFFRSNRTAADMIRRLTSLYEALFTDPITVKILFRYSDTWPDGTPLCGALAESQSGTTANHPIPWNTFFAQLRADAKTDNDAIAIASLSQPPPNPLPQGIVVTTANGRALGLMTTPPKLCADGTIHDGCPYDGIITLNSDPNVVTWAFSRPVSLDEYDAQSTIEHEIDEVLGLGSYLNLAHPGPTPDPTYPQPQDLFSWEARGMRNITTTGSRHFSIDSGSTNIVDFNQLACGDFGDWQANPNDTCDNTHCLQAHPYVQNAFGCPGQFEDISPTSPETINLDIIGYDRIPPPRPTPPPHVTPVPPPPSPRPTPWPRPTPPPHLTPVPPPSSPRPTPVPRP